MFDRMTLGFGRTPVSIATISGIAVVGFMGLKVAAATQYKAERVVLDNGVTVLLLPMPETDQVAIETFYNVGFVHEPKGMTQAAHLLEHLACNAATGNYKPNEAMNLLNQFGMANAETLPSWTHYDYVLPANKLELALQIEAERLTSLNIDREIVRIEALRCYQETDFVERNPASGMTKHAFMALNQAWRHGMTSALVRGGLEDFSIEELKSFHRAFYRPDNLTVVIIGGFNRDHAFELIEEHLGDVRPPKRSRPAAIDWSRIPDRTTVRWDAKVRAVCLAFPPPSNRRDQIALSLLGAALTQELINDPEINAVASTVTCTNHLWSVGELPFYVYATAKPEASLEDVERALARWMRSITVERPANGVVVQMRMMADQLSQQISALTWSYVENAAKMVARQRGGDEKFGLGMVLGQSAINWAVADRLIGPDPATSMSGLSSLTADKLHDLIVRYLDPDKQIVCLLMPAAVANQAD